MRDAGRYETVLDEATALVEALRLRPFFAHQGYYAVGYAIARRESLAVSVGSGVSIVASYSEKLACDRVREQLLPEYPEEYGWAISLTAVEVISGNSDMRRPSVFPPPASKNGKVTP